MSTLATLQSDFQQHLLGAGDAAVDAIAQEVRPGGIGIARRLAVYHHAYRARLAETLADSYGHTATYLGADWFERDARAYIEDHPSTHTSLRWYGSELPAWFAARYPDDGDIAELAALDWALRQAFDGADAEPLAAADVGAVPPAAWPTVRLLLHPTLARLRLQHNTLALWQALDQDEAPPRAERLAQPLELLVWRLGLKPHFRSLGAAEAAAITALQQGLDFGALCEHLAAAYPQLDVAPELGVLLRRWLEEGLLVAALHDAQAS